MNVQEIDLYLHDFVQHDINIALGSDTYEPIFFLTLG